MAFIGLPPDGAAPSSPRRGELVVAVRTRLARAWLYADGRLITLHYEDRPGGANPVSTGLLEQRLTVGAVERMRSYVARSGTGLGPAPTRPATGPANPLVRVGGRLRVVDPPSTACDARSCTRITEPETWLPPRAWQTRQLRAYVPSRFAVCYGLRGSGDTADVEDAPAVPDASLFGRTAAADRRLPADWPCSVVTTPRATRIVEALRGARVLRDSDGRVEDPGVRRRRPLARPGEPAARGPALLRAAPAGLQLALHRLRLSQVAGQTRHACRRRGAGTDPTWRSTRSTRWRSSGAGR